MYRQATRAFSGVLSSSGFPARRELLRQAPGWARHFRAPVRKVTTAPYKLPRAGFAALASASHAKPAVNKLQLARELGVQLPDLCPGCGVLLQSDSPDAPGYFQVPQRLLQQAAQQRAAEKQGATVAADAAQTEADAEQDAERLQRQQDVPASTSDAADTAQPSVLCARCYSLKNYGRVVSQVGEAALPTFDLNRKVGTKIKLQKYRRAVVLCVVDIVDFDGSLPRQALQELLPGLAEGQFGSPGGLGYRLIIAASKVDLLPHQATAARLQAWVQRRCKQAGLPPPAAVHLVSNIKGTGIKELLGSVQDMVGTRGDVWVVGAQNAGKSSLINAMQKLAGVKASQQITTAAHPGTTLGMLKVEGLLQSGCKMWDTPGVPHHYQLSSKLNADEVRMLLPRRQLKPRTYRMMAGQTVFIGCLARFDIVRIPGQTVYLTVWASDEVTCHYGRTEKAADRMEASGGTQLVPPLGGSRRLDELGPLLPQAVLLEGDSWQESSVDVAIAGLGWAGIGVKGPADLKVWVHEGVSVTTHAAILPDYARMFESPGFTEPKQLKASNLKASNKMKTNKSIRQ